MSIPSKKKIESEIKKLRVIVDNGGEDEILIRIAYAVENALRWAIEDTTDWQTPSQDVFDEVRLLKERMSAK